MSHPYRSHAEHHSYAPSRPRTHHTQAHPNAPRSTSTSCPPGGAMPNQPSPSWPSASPPVSSPNQHHIPTASHFPSFSTLPNSCPTPRSCSHPRYSHSLSVALVAHSRLPAQSPFLAQGPHRPLPRRPLLLLLLRQLRLWQRRLRPVGLVCH